MEETPTPAARLSALAVELTRCTDELLACIDREEMDTFNALLDERHRLMSELRAAVTGSAPEAGWRTTFAGVLESEARLKARVESEHQRLATELQGMGETRTNFDRLAEMYMEPDV
jgi:hypothetical protein